MTRRTIGIEPSGPSIFLGCLTALGITLPFWIVGFAIVFWVTRR